MKENFVDFFNPENMEHIHAYYDLKKTGQWPKKFWNKIEDMEISPNWNVMIMAKLADAWIEFKIYEEILP
jgi:hypothetical protein